MSGMTQKPPRVVVSTSVDPSTYAGICSIANTCSCSVPTLLRYWLYHGSMPSTLLPGATEQVRIRTALSVCAALWGKITTHCGQEHCDHCHSFASMKAPVARSGCAGGQRPGRRPLARTTVTSKFSGVIARRAQSADLTVQEYLRQRYAQIIAQASLNYSDESAPEQTRKAINDLARCLVLAAGPAPCIRCVRRVRACVLDVIAVAPPWPERTYLEAVIHAASPV
jgi:hypothetical protein